jgi:putative peptide zinc metalloprotease protein
MLPGQPPPEAMPLPALREDMRLLPSRRAADGSPQWVVFDALAHSYLQLDLEAFQLLSCWTGAGTAGGLASAVEIRHGRKPDIAEIMEMIGFVQNNRLTVDPAGGWRGLAAAQARGHESILKSAVHNYLFFKVPLVRPDTFLRRTLPAARMLASPASLVAIAALGLIGIFLASRRWDQFIGTFNDFWTPAGAGFFAATLLALKLLHELGHGYVAAAKGCRVPSMGVAFMLGAPMPYTDVTDAWKLARRRDRMAIDLAGVSVELCVAGLATFAWVFLPDGPARAVAFVFATTAWIMSLAVNLNPFMRFDGYFVLADALGVPNLQQRAFALGKWRLRRFLFGADDPAPDALDGGLRRFVILYGYAVWIYRLVLFTGIALVVYYMFFKALGILLFAIEIGVFIVMPVWRELQHWWKERSRYRANRRTLATGAAALLLIAAFVLPWSSHVRIPAVLEPLSFARVFPRSPGEVTRVHAVVGAAVNAGDPLVELQQPRLTKELAQAEVRLSLLRDRMDRRVADRKDLAATPQMEQEIETLEAKRAALRKEIEELVIRAPIAGVVVELNPMLHAGRSLPRDEEIAVVAAQGRLVTRGYVGQEDLWRLRPGSAGVFLPEDLLRDGLPVTLREAAPAGARSIEIPLLSSAHGGKVETWPQTKAGDLPPVHASHLILFDVAGSIGARPPGQVLRGTVRVEAAPQSYAARAWRHVLRVLVQESGA